MGSLSAPSESAFDAVLTLLAPLGDPAKAAEVIRSHREIIVERRNAEKAANDAERRADASKRSAEGAKAEADDAIRQAATSLDALALSQAKHDEREANLTAREQTHARAVAKHAEDVQAFNEAKALHESTVNETLASAQARLKAAEAEFKRAADLARAAEQDRADAAGKKQKAQALLDAAEAMR